MKSVSKTWVKAWRAAALCALVVGGEAVAQPDTVWTKTFGTNGASDWCQRLISTRDGGYLIAGYTDPEQDAGYEYLLVKLNSDFEEEWTRAYHWSHQQRLESVAELPEGGYVMVGDTRIDGDSLNWIYPCIARVNSEGNLLWANAYGGRNGNFLDLIVNELGQIVVTGYGGGNGGWLVEVDEAGEVLWEQPIGGSVILGITKVRDGGYIMSGWKSVRELGQQGYLVKTDSIGNREWSMNYGGSYGEGFSTVIPTSDGGFVGGGTSTEFRDIDFYIVKADSIGNELWSHIYQNRGTDILQDVIILPDGGFLAVGKRTGGFRSYAAYRLDSNGELLWQLNYGDHSRLDWLDAALVMSDNSFLIAGTGLTTRNQAERDFWLIRTEPDSLLANNVVLLDPAFPSSSLSSPFPSPFNSSLTIPYTLSRPGVVRIALFDLAGREVAVLQEGRSQQAGPYAVRWDGNGYGAGSYVLMMNVGKEVMVRKVVLVR